MEREIKFRIWMPEKFMEYIDFKTSCDFSHPIRHTIYMEGAKKNGLPIMQYTGLKDKNGKEIYEGDIVKVEIYVTSEIQKNIIFEVEIVRGVIKGLPIFVTDDTTNLRLDFEYDTEKVEVIGNIYESNNLINKSK